MPSGIRPNGAVMTGSIKGPTVSLARELLAAELVADYPELAAELRTGALLDDDFETHTCAAIRAIETALTEAARG